MALEVTSAPATEPVSLTEAKAWLKVTDTSEDDLIALLIKAWRNQCERKTKRSFITQTLALYLDEFPSSDEIELLRPPVQSVTSVTYVDINGGTQTFSSGSYTLDKKSLIPKIVLDSDAYWPATSDVPNAVTVTYVAGYGAASAVPEDIKAAILCGVAHSYENRESIVVGSGYVQISVSKTSDFLLRPFTLSL